MDSEVSIQDYFLVRHDRNRPGGGVAIHKRNSIPYNVLLHGSDLELLIVSLSKSSCMFCSGVYSIHSHPLYLLFLIICEILLSVNQSSASKFVLLYDFDVNLCASNSLFPYLCSLMTGFSLTQVVDSPTHFVVNQQSSFLDSVLYLNLHSFSDCSIIPQLSNSDHLGMMLPMKCHHTGMSFVPIPC